MGGDIGAGGVHLCRLLRNFLGDVLQFVSRLLNCAALLVYVVRPALYLAGNVLQRFQGSQYLPAPRRLLHYGVIHHAERLVKRLYLREHRFHQLYRVGGNGATSNTVEDLHGAHRGTEDTGRVGNAKVAATYFIYKFFMLYIY